jgi:hypothetical protein
MSTKTVLCPDRNRILGSSALMPTEKNDVTIRSRSDMFTCFYNIMVDRRGFVIWMRTCDTICHEQRLVRVIDFTRAIPDRLIHFKMTAQSTLGARAIQLNRNSWPPASCSNFT